jgi:hypothetical protein
VIVKCGDKQMAYAARYGITHILAAICAHRWWAGRSATSTVWVVVVERSNNRA